VALVVKPLAGATRFDIDAGLLKPDPPAGCGKCPKRGRKRFFNATIHALRTRVDRTFAWETNSNGCCGFNIFSNDTLA
jgi:hypothetical protein